MAPIAGIGCADGHRQVGPRDADRMIAPHVDNHVGARGHVAVRALGAGQFRLVTMMRLGIELRRQMALAAHLIPRRPQLEAVRIVAIRAGHPHLEHAALPERTVFIDLIEDLSVRMVQAGVEKGGHVRIQERMSIDIAGGDLAPTRMAARACLQLRARLAGRGPVRGTAGRIELPSSSSRIAQRDE